MCAILQTGDMQQPLCRSASISSYLGTRIPGIKHSMSLAGRALVLTSGPVLAQTIIDTNNLVGKALEAGQPLTVIMEHWDFLQVQCAMYINSDLPGLPMAYQSTSKPLRCVHRPLQNCTLAQGMTPCLQASSLPPGIQNKAEFFLTVSLGGHGPGRFCT